MLSKQLLHSLALAHPKVSRLHMYRGQILLVMGYLAKDDKRKSRLGQLAADCENEAIGILMDVCDESTF